MPADIGGNQPVQNTSARRILSSLAILLLGLCCAYVTYVHATVGVLPYDDSFITFRYVSNLFNGKGLVYNTGEHVFGSSTPLYLAWLVLLKTLAPSAKIPALAARGNIVFYLAAGLGALFLVRSLLSGQWRMRWSKADAVGAVTATLFLIRFDMLTISTGANEMFLFATLVLWAFFFLITKQYVLSGLLAGLSIMARPEGVFCAFLCGLIWLLHNRRKPVLFALSLGGPGLIWTCFAFFYYGTPIYHSLIAKSQPLYPFPAGFAFNYIVGRLAFWTVGNDGAVYDICVVMAAAVAGFAFRRRICPLPWFVIPSFAGLILLFYAVSNPFMFDWYFLVLFLGWFLLIAVGLSHLFSAAAEAVRVKFGLATISFVFNILSFAIPVFFLANSAAFTWQTRDSRSLPGYLPRDHAELRTLIYKEVAEFINSVGDPSDTIAAPEVGALGYYSRNHLYDACGLVTPEAIPFLPLPYGKRVGPNIGSISAEFAKAVNADWIVTMEVFSIESLADDPWFKENYALVKVFPLFFRTFSSDNVLVFHHK
ncbi:hypothetical protein HZA56_05000 [Candidatus Poribacteria bacterium]|nr:hypothetical protein [Candidatus Poribacteria bacterium]